MTCVFGSFASCDIVRVFPPFKAHVVVLGKRCTRQDAVGSWRRHHAAGHAHCAAGAGKKFGMECVFCGGAGEGPAGGAAAKRAHGAQTAGARA